MIDNYGCGISASTFVAWFIKWRKDKPFLIFIYENLFLLLNPEVLGLPRYEVISLNGAIHEQSISTKIIDTAEKTAQN